MQKKFVLVLLLPLLLQTCAGHVIESKENEIHSDAEHIQVLDNFLNGVHHFTYLPHHSNILLYFTLFYLFYCYIVFYIHGVVILLIY